MKTQTQMRKPRNPFALLARRRHAGSHRPTVAALRRHTARDLERELDTLKPFAP